MKKTSDNFRVGGGLTIMLNDKDTVYEFKTNIQDITDQTLTIAAPTRRGRALELPVGSYLHLMLEIGGQVHNYTSRIIQLRLGAVPLWIILKPHLDTDLEQRRDFYRLPILFELSYATVQPEQPAWLFGRGCDISGGGLGFIAETMIPLNTALKLEFNLGGIRYNLSGTVVRATKLRGRCLIGVQFTDMPSKARDELVKFIFKEQIRYLQKGLR